MASDEKQSADISRRLLNRVWGYARPYRMQILFILTAIGFSTVLALFPPLIYRQLIDHALPKRDIVQLNWLALAMVAGPLLSGLIGVAQRYQSARVGEGLICDLRQELYLHMQTMSLSFFTRTKTGEIMARLNNDVVGAQRAITGTLISIVTNAIQVAFTLSIMLSLEWRLALASMAILPLFVLPARRVGAKLRTITRQSFDLNARMNALMNETLNISGALLMKLFGRQQENMSQFQARSRAVADIGVQQAVIGRWFFMSLGLISAVGTALVFWLGGHLVLQDAFTVGTIVAFAAYLVQLYGPISALANARVDFATSMVSFERVFEVVDLQVEITNSPNATPLHSAEGRVVFEEVSFAYSAPNNTADPSPIKGDPSRHSHHAPIETVIPRLRAVKRSDPGMYHQATSRGVQPDTDYEPYSARQWAVSDVSFAIEPGQLAALVGPSGAGKTTLTYLLPRLYDPTHGRISIDGLDLRNALLESLAGSIGMVTQETYLFHDTIRANLLYAKPHATQTALDTACKAANILEFISRLPDKFDTIVGERGYRLSGGEKQRVAIARVLLKDPRILILDEATSSLDSRSEALIQDAIKPLLLGRTSLVIAHRLSTILAADIILVMDDGKLVEQGTHLQLLAQKGLYAELYATQFRASVPAPNPVHLNPIT